MNQFGHPCPKPIKWAKILLKKILPNGGRVMDCFLGSGTTRIAAYKLGLDFWGYEIDKDYFREGCERFEKAIAEPLFDSIKPEQGRLL